MYGWRQIEEIFSLNSIFWTWEDSYDDVGSTTRRNWPSDEDKGVYWVDESRIDGKASAFIAKIHEVCLSESEHHIV